MNLKSLPKFFPTLAPVKPIDQSYLYHDEIFGNFPVEIFAWPSPNLSICKDRAMYLYDNWLVVQKRIAKKDLAWTVQEWAKSWFCMDCDDVTYTDCKESESMDFVIVRLQMRRPLCSLMDLVTFLRLFYARDLVLEELSTRVLTLIQDFANRCNQANTSLKLDYNNIRLSSLVVCFKVWSGTPHKWQDWLDSLELRFAFPWSPKTNDIQPKQKLDETRLIHMLEFVNPMYPAESSKRIENSVLKPPFMDDLCVSVLLIQLVVAARFEFEMELRMLRKLSIASLRWWADNPLCIPQAICTMFLEVCVKMNALLPDLAIAEIYTVEHDNSPIPPTAVSTPATSQLLFSQESADPPRSTPKHSRQNSVEYPPPPPKRLKPATPELTPTKKKKINKKDPCLTCGNKNVLFREGHDRSRCNLCVVTRDRQVIFHIPTLKPILEENLVIVPTATTVEGPFKCDWCHTTETPRKRKGPKGANTLCNACGVVYWRKHEVNETKPRGNKQQGRRRVRGLQG